MRYRKYFRKPRTKNDRTQFYALNDVELNVVIKIRGRRRPGALEYAWDDFVRSDWNGRCWKVYRRMQWKA